MNCNVSLDVPNDVKIAFADFLIAFSALELEVETYLEGVLDLPQEAEVLTSKIDTSRKFSLLKELSGRRSEKGIRDINPRVFEVLPKIIENRNRIVHGTWAMINGVPGVLLFRAKTSSKITNRLEFELFQLDRINFLAELTWDVRNELQRSSKEMGFSHIDPDAQTHNLVNVRDIRSPRNLGPIELIRSGWRHILVFWVIFLVTYRQIKSLRIVPDDPPSK